MAPVGFSALPPADNDNYLWPVSTVPHHLALSETPRGVGTEDQLIFVVETRGKKLLICCVEFLTGQKHLSAQNKLLLSITVFILLQKHLLENYFGCIIEKNQA